MYDTSSSTTSAKLELAVSDRYFFQRVLVAIDVGREINLKAIMDYEIAPTPLSIADTIGNS